MTMLANDEDVQIGEAPEGPHCIIRGCPMTMGYYTGGGTHICWLHAITVPEPARSSLHEQDRVALKAWPVSLGCLKAKG
jgi:hypothetical protein